MQSPEQDQLDEEVLKLQIKVIEETQMVGRIIEQMKELLKKRGQGHFNFVKKEK